NWAGTLLELEAGLRDLEELLRDPAEEFACAVVPKKEFSCFRCGQPGHRRKECRAKVECDKCGSRGHITAMCRTHIVRDDGGKPIAKVTTNTRTTTATTRHGITQGEKLADVGEWMRRQGARARGGDGPPAGHPRPEPIEIED